MSNFYLNKYGLYPAQIKAPPSLELGMIIVIPCFNETGLLDTLNSLIACEFPGYSVEVIIVFNSSEIASEEIKSTNTEMFNDTCGWIKDQQNKHLQFHVLAFSSLPAKHAGVGLARKIGMDEAVFRFEEIKNEEGIIVCLDADCTVSKNYLLEIEKCFSNPGIKGCSIHYEHPLAGNDQPEIYRAITDYELFLRYYNQGLRYAGFPYAFHTIGSSMAVRSSVYQMQGGMNRRKAGEDFYFLHKIIPIGGFVEITDALVFPSPRISDRVPFGTGKAVGRALMEKKENYQVYHPQVFSDLKLLFYNVPKFYKESKPESFPKEINSFLIANQFENKLKEIRNNVSSQELFVKRFFDWFNGFMVLKFVHYCRDNFYGEMEISEACAQLMGYRGGADIPKDKTKLLCLLREMDKEEYGGYLIKKAHRGMSL